MAIRVEELPPFACDRIMVPSPELGNRVSMGAPTRHGSPPPRSSRPKKRYSAPESIGRSMMSPHLLQTLRLSKVQSSRWMPHAAHCVGATDAAGWGSSSATSDMSLKAACSVCLTRCRPGNSPLISDYFQVWWSFLLILGLRRYLHGGPQDSQKLPCLITPCLLQTVNHNLIEHPRGIISPFVKMCMDRTER